MSGLIVAMLSMAFAVWSVAAETIPAVWPMRTIKRAEDPTAFWAIVTAYAVTALGGVIYSFFH